jgi:beta-lactamase regulating signal transducer with metallopeptidase domain
MNWAFLAHALGSSILHFLWVGTLLGGAMWLLRRGVDGARPETRHAISLLSLVAMLMGMAGTYFVVSRKLSLERLGPAWNLDGWSHSDLLLLANALDSASLPTIADQTPMPFLLLAGFWATGATALLLRFTVGWRASCSVAHSARTLSGGLWFDILPRLLAEMQVVRRVRIASSHLLGSPAVFGIVRPTIIVPTALLLSWTPMQVEMALLHEIAHIKRHDNVIRMMQRIIESLLFFHPITWLLSADLSRDREDCCDAVVLKHRHDRRLYARTLYSLAGKPARVSVSLSSMADRALLPRVRRILEKDASMISPRQRVVHLAVAVLLVYALILSVDAQVGPAAAPESSAAVEVQPKAPTDLVRVLRLDDVTSATQPQEEPTSEELKRLTRALREAMVRIDKLEADLRAIQGPAAPRDPRAQGDLRSPRAPRAPVSREVPPVEQGPRAERDRAAAAETTERHLRDLHVLRAKEEALKAAQAKDRELKERSPSSPRSDEWFDRSTRKQADADEKLKLQMEKLEALDLEAQATRVAAEEMRVQVERLRKDIKPAEAQDKVRDAMLEEHRAHAAALHAHLEAARSELQQKERLLREAEKAASAARGPASVPGSDVVSNSPSADPKEARLAEAILLRDSKIMEQEERLRRQNEVIEALVRRVKSLESGPAKPQGK